MDEAVKLLAERGEDPEALLKKAGEVVTAWHANPAQKPDDADWCNCGAYAPDHVETDHCSECGALPHVPCHESCRYGAYEEMP